MLIVFLLQDNATLVYLESLTEELVFHDLSYVVMFWNISRIYFFSFLAYKTLRGIVWLIFSNFFQSPFSDGKFIPFQLYLFIKGLVFVILCRSFLISSWFNATVTAYWKHFSSFFVDRIYCCFSVFYPVRRIYIWSTIIEIYFMAFTIP